MSLIEQNMLKRENDLRLGSEVQERYRQGGYDTYVKITEEVQRQVADIMYVHVMHVS
jgi:hypothetical protein